MKETELKKKIKWWPRILTGAVILFWLFLCWNLYVDTVIPNTTKEILAVLLGACPILIALIYEGD